MQNIAKRVNNLFKEQFLTTKDEAVIKASEVIYFYYENGKNIAVTEEKEHEVKLIINELTKELGNKFLRTHRFYLVNFEHIHGISRHYSKTKPTEEMMNIESVDYQIILNNMAKVPVSSSYEKKVKKALGIKSMDYLVPDNPIARRLRELKLTDFGFREIEKLDKTDPLQVEAFKEKHDIKRFEKEKMLRHFRQVTYKEIDKALVIRNVIWQIYRWITWGIEKPKEGNIRSLWYKIKAVLAYHSDIFEANDVDTFYSVLTTMIERDKLFRYRDFGFLDMNEPYRGIGEAMPEIILASEKVGHYYFIKKLASEIQCSFICLRGEPSHISLEYFSDDLKEKLPKDKTLKVFSITDLDPAGASIANNLVLGLQDQNLEVEQMEELVNINTFAKEELKFFRFPVVRYEKQDNELIPLPPSNKAQLTKTIRWYEGKINDKNFMSRDKIEDRFVYTIYGIESDAADRMVLRKKFLEAVKITDT